MPIPARATRATHPGKQKKKGKRVGGERSLSMCSLAKLIHCFLSRYETRNFDKSANNSVSELGVKPLESSFSQMTLNTDGGKISIVDEGSERLTSMTQRVMERKSFTTTTESRSETKTEKHSFRLE